MTGVNQLNWTFDTVACEYERIRPGYPDELYRSIFNYINIDKSSSVIEIGIGGAQATPPILKTGCKLTAVEYGENFSKLCSEKFKDYPRFSLVTGRFEDIDFEPNSYDFVYSASAFHWIPEEIGYKKVFTVLKSGGAFVRFANHPYYGGTKLFDEIQKLYAVYMPSSPTPAEYTSDMAKQRAEIAYKYNFINIKYELFKRTRSLTAEEYTTLLGTYSDHIALEENLRKEFFARIRHSINSFGGQITIYDTIDMQLARKP